MINEFKGQYRFLSNFYMSPVVFEGDIYPSSEHAYMAAKSLDSGERRYIASLPTPKDAKQAGRKIILRPGWEGLKYSVMLTILLDKFTRHEALKNALIATGDQTLVEGNWWGDKIWGVCLKTNQGQNLLGKCLMEVREMIRPVQEKRVIAVIGTAGRDKSIPMGRKHWDQMTDVIGSEVSMTDYLVSGGAAWADHVAIWAYLTDKVSALTLHMPAPIVGKHFGGAYGTSGAACNYYHEKFSKIMGMDSLEHIRMAIQKGATVTYQPVAMGYQAMAARNALVARDCTHMVAFTFGQGNEPADGGTKITWDMAASKQRAHVPLIH